MKRIILAICSIALLFTSISVMAQPAGNITANAAGCDTINFPIPTAWSRANYSIIDGANTGYRTGTNTYGDKEKAHFFDVSASANTYLTRCYIYFAKANSINQAGLNKTINIKVYDGTSNTPGALLGSTSTTLENIRIDVLLNDKTDIFFPAAISLPASKKFFLSVDYSSLSWPNDSLAIYSSLSGRTPNYAWEKWQDNSWNTVTSESGLSLSLFMNPFLSTNTTCQLVQPVTMGSFTGLLSNKGHELSWTTFAELNNKGFYVQYAANGHQFETVGFVPSKAADGTSTQPLAYSFVHQPSSTYSQSHYRLMQADKDGKTSYSKQIALRNGALSTAVIAQMINTPGSGVLQVGFAKPLTGNTQWRTIDAAGRIMQQQTLQSNVSQAYIPTGTLSKGLYVLQIVNEQGQLIDTEKFWIQ
jgi:hypothetical protein